VDKWITRSPV